MKRLTVFLAMAWPALSAGPNAWELSQFAEFSKGRFRGVALTREGVLEPGLLADANATLTTGESSVWSLLTGPNGAEYFGTGPRGKIFASNPAKRTLEDLGSPGSGHVFALALDRAGVLYAALSPGGQVFKRSGSSWQLYAQCGAKFIWALSFGGDGALYAAAGDEGKLFRIVNGQAEVWFESGQANLTSLAWDPSGALLVGSDPNGILYRVTGKNAARVLFDAPFGEIRAIAPGNNGEVYFLAMGGIAGKRANTTNTSPQSSGTGSVPQVTTTITVTEEAAAQTAINLQPKPATPAAPAAAPAALASSTEIPGLDRSAIYRLNADSTADQIYVTKEESIFDLALRDGRLYFTSDNRGRLYRLEADRQPALLAEINENEVSRLGGSGPGWVVISSSAGKALRLAATPAAEGEYESPVHEAASIARWGTLEFEPGPLFESRSGNSTKPDSTWSAWQALAPGNRIASPAGKYLQWRFKSKGAFKLRSVVARYLPRNRAPVVKSITAALSVSSQRTPSTTAPAASSAVYTLTVTDTGEPGAATSSGTSTLLPTRPILRQMLVSWTSEDPDADALEYKLEYRAEDESRWKLLKENLSETSFAIDADALADGRYFFRVTASDAPSNTLDTSLDGQLQSVPVELDQTAPDLSLQRASGVVRIEARDRASAIRRLEYSLNGGPWRGLDPLDGILDSRSEAAEVKLSNLKLEAGENTLTVRAIDTALNVAIRKLILR
jgi:hypothetical protein